MKKKYEKRFKPTDPIDLSLFAHIQNDPFLMGTFDLQGNQFGRTFGYLDRYFSEISSDELTPKLQQLKKIMAKLVEIEQLIQAIRELPSYLSKPRRLDQLSDNLALEISTLETGQSIALPGGWKATNGGHAMVYEFKKTESGIVFNIHNSGAGINYHERKSALDRELYYPVMRYFIPSPIDQKKLSAYIQALLTPQIPELRAMGETTFDEKDLYEEILPKIAFLNAQLKSASEGSDAYTAGQLSGTCAQRVLHQMIKTNFSSLHEYQQFIYRFKRFALDDFISVLKKNNQLHDPALQIMINEAIAVLLRTLNIDEVFTDDFIAREREQLKDYQLLLKQTTIPAPSIKAKQIAITLPQSKITIPPIPPVIVPHLPSSFAEQSVLAMSNKTLKGGPELLKEVNEWIAECDHLDKLHDQQAIIDGLESLFSKFPLPYTPQTFADKLAFYEGLNQENIEIFYQQLSTLQQRYLKACHAVRGEALLPNQFVVALSINSVLDYVTYQFPFKTSGTLTFHQLMVQVQKHLLKENVANPYFATNNPILDERLIHIRNLYLADDSSMSNIFMYYNELIDSEPELKKQLIGLFNTLYIPDHDLSRLIRQEHYEALYYFINNIDALKKIPAFQRLITQFERHDQLEKITLAGLGPFIRSLDHGTPSEKKIIGLHSKEKLGFDSMGTFLLRGIHNQQLKEYKYKLPAETPEYQALLEDYPIQCKERTDNDVQLLPSSMTPSKFRALPSKEKQAITEKVIDQAALAERELFHLRASPNQQIQLTLDYFQRMLHKLSSPAYQIYFEANFMQPGLLLHELRDREAMISERVEHFVEDGLRYFEHLGQSSKTSIFFIHLDYLFNHYAAACSKAPKERLQKLQQKIAALLVIDEDNTAEIRQALHQYQFLTAMSRLEFSPHLSADEESEILNLALTSYLFIHANPNEQPQMDASFLANIEQKKHRFKLFIADKKADEIEKRLPLAIKTLALGECVEIEPISDTLWMLKIKKNESLFSVHLDVKLGLFFNSEGLALAPLPLNLIQHPVIKQLDLQLDSKTQAWVSQDGNILELFNKEVRFIRENEHAPFRLQKKWTIDGETQWYELRAFSLEQKRSFDLDVPLISLPLEPILIERSMRVWASCEQPDQLLITDNQRPFYHLKPTAAATADLVASQLDPFGQSNGWTLAIGRTWFHEFFSKFESPSFMTVCQKGNSFQITFPRYDLTLLAEDKGDHWEYSIAEQPDLILVNDITLLLPDAAGLIFENKKTKQRLCYIPQQPFFPTGEPDERSPLYELKPDLSMISAENLLKEHLKKHSTRFQPWQYTGIERCLVCSLNKENILQPNTTEDALYLCYMYLCSHEPEKAWLILEDCAKRLGGLDGTFGELRILHMIIKMLPFITVQQHQKATIQTPAYVACQLKAMALFTHAVSDNRNIQYPTGAHDLTTPDGWYRAQILNGIIEFDMSFNETIGSLYSRYMNMQRSLDYQFQLSDDEKKSLLDYHYVHLPSKEEKKPVGALGYAWKELEIKMLKKEYAAILAEQRYQGMKLPQAQKKRLKEIEHFLEQDALVSQHHSDLELVPIDLSIPSDYVFKLELLNATAYEYQTITDWLNKNLSELQYHPLEHFLSRALSTLTPNITEKDFLYLFPSYLQLAILPEQADKKERAILLDFCHKYLIANRYTPLNAQSNHMCFLINILYRILLNPELFQFDKIKEINGYALFQRARELPDPSIEIYQIVDNTHQVLSNARQLWDHLDTVVAAPREQLIASRCDALEQFDLTHLLSMSSFDESFLDLCGAYQAAADLFNGLNISQETAPLVPGALSAQELTSGDQQTKALESMKKIAYDLLGNPETRRLLQESTKTLLNTLETELQERLSHALTLAQSGPSELKKKRHRDIAVESRAHAPLTKDTLLALYFNGDMANYALETGLSDEKIRQLHTELSHYVALSVRQNTLKRLDNKLQESQKADADPTIFQEIAQELLSNDRVDYEKESVLAFFQYQENLILRPQQIRAIKRILENTDTDPKASMDTIEKVVMGGGKSKVLLPILAQRLATGHNLVAVCVPPPLLRTNRIDLLNTSMHLFNQRACRFDFTRDSPCSPKHLERIYHQLEDTVANKNYLVTTCESLQSLDLKYIELLRLKPKKDSPEYLQWTEQIQWLEKIVGLFRNRSDILIDEVHQGLSLKKKLNYALGTYQAPPLEIMENTVELYQFFDQVPLDSLGETLTGQTFASLFKDHSLMIASSEAEENSKWQAASQLLAKALLHHPASPLNALFNSLEPELNDEDKEALFHYFFNEGQHIPTCVAKAPSKARNIFALYKEQLSHLLLHTLRRKLNEHYGRSHQQPHLLIAVPYRASNTPNERSLFGNFVASINYSVQMTLLEGIPQSALKHYLENLQAEAKKELLKNPTLGSMKNTKAAKQLLENAPELSYALNQIHLDDEQQFAQIYSTLKMNPQLMKAILTSDVLTQIRVEETILSSNAISFVDFCRRVIGLSGTPYNYLTYHPRIHFDPLKASTSDGFIVQVIQKKSILIRPIHHQPASNEKTSIEYLLEQLFSGKKPEEQVRAIIDICANFRGIDNKIVAKQLAQYIRQHPTQFTIPTPIEYILYFNENDVLCALSVNADAVPIEIGSTDPKIINEKLACQPSARFSFYDQSHITGTDLKQAPHAKALVFVDHKTQLLKEFTQGCMRMRGLPDDQTIEVIVPEELGSITIEELLHRMEENQIEESKEEVFTATFLKLTMTITHDLYERLLAIPDDDIETKHQFLECCSSYFQEQHSKEFYEIYGGLSVRCPTKLVFEEKRDALMRDWKRILQEMNMSPPLQSSEIMQANLDTIIHDALPYCAETCVRPVSEDYDTEVQIEDIAEKLTQVEVATQHEVLAEKYNPQLLPEYYSKPTQDLQERHLHSCPSLDILFEQMDPKTSTPPFGPILVTANYYQTYRAQKTFLDVFLKPVHVILFRQFSDGYIDCILLSPKEADEFQRNMTGISEPRIWLTTTQHSLLAGTPPKNLLQNQIYLELIEQIRYFNGELDLLMNNEQPHPWLDDHTTTALTFFQEHLMDCRKIEQPLFDQFKEQLSHRLNGFDYIVKHFDQNLETCDWRAIIAQELSDHDIQECHHLAQAFHFLISHWEDSKFSIDVTWNLMNPQRPIYPIIEHCKRLFPMSKEAFSCLSTFYTKQILPLLDKAYFQYFKTTNPKIQSAFASILPCLIKEYLPTIIDSKQMDFPYRFLLEKMGTQLDHANLIIVLDWIAKKSPSFISYKEKKDGLSPLDFMIQKDNPYVLNAVHWLLEHGAKIKQVPREIWLHVSDSHMLNYLTLPKVLQCETFLSVYLERYLQNDEKMVALLDAHPKAKKLLSAHPDRLRDLNELKKSRTDLSEEHDTQTKTGWFSLFYRKKPTEQLTQKTSTSIKPR